jgi:hypothetical protein
MVRALLIRHSLDFIAGKRQSLITHSSERFYESGGRTQFATSLKSDNYLTES